MQTVDRSGVHIEQCQGCRGIFLDRGELEQMVSAEQRYNAAAAPPPYRADSAPPYRGAGGGYPAQQHYNDSAPPYRGGGYPPRHGDSPPPYGHKRKKRSFLEDLFD
jgi:Zn-finger nucleic acid-binding protein